MPTARPGRPPARGRSTVRFDHKLVLNQWLLSLFGVKQFKDLAEHLRGEGLEGLDENNVHHFHHALTAQFFNLTYLPTELLLEYDQNIVRHTQRLNERRITRGEAPIAWKYFQYLALLFTEVFLDRYFTDPEALLADLNEQIAAYNEDKAKADQLEPLDAHAEAWPQLNKLAFWMATGSGKTLVMHAHILQFQAYLAKHGRQRELNQIILLTPNEGLSQQHLREFEAAGIDAELFDKEGGGLYSGQRVQILEVTRLGDEMGDKTVAVAAFEDNNLVLVDEGHRGASSGGGGAWMRYRNALCARGFAFEYSATFGQAVKAKSKGAQSLEGQYAKTTLFNYSYRYFYSDGFGKDYQILNLDEGTETDHLELYLVACLLSFFQQLRLYRDQESALRPFQLEKPLWIFVGGKVTATLAKKDASDIVQVVQFLARYVSGRAVSIEHIDRVLNQGLVTSKGTSLFAGRFAYLNTLGLSASEIFDETLAMLFNAPGGGQLYVENLKGATGEVALRVGAENDAFGVINVGDDAKLVKLCDKEGLATGELEFSGSLFHELNKTHSPVNVLIGSKKFTEGWSSWRVSTMGLMNVGKSEGAQIIQLFGRGVRLKGIRTSLKRSSQASLPNGLERPKHIGLLETLGIFGIQANYMAQFRDFLEDEGLPTNDDRIEFLLPVIKNLGTQKLKTVRLKKTIGGVSTEFGTAFRKLAPIPTVGPPDPESDPSTAYLQKNQVVLDRYPKVQAMQAPGLVDGSPQATLNQAHLSARHVAFLDVDALYFELERFKAERGWYNLNLTREGIVALLADSSWYRLLIPQQELAFDSFERVATWQALALALLKKYTERYYIFRKREWELPHLEYRALEGSDPNFPSVQESPGENYYRVLVDRSQEEIITKLEELKAIIGRGELKAWQFQGIHAVCFGQHLYQPLLYLDSNVVEVSPTPLNKGEREFVEDLKRFHDGNEAYFEDKELYLLRNLSRGKGVGFFEAGNFHPDFILWLLKDGKQHVIFVDPKGIRNLGPSDPKIQFHATIKEIEQRLGDEAVQLDSFIVSNTPSADMRLLWDMDKAEMTRRHIVFQAEDKDSYIGHIVGAVRT